MKQGRAEFVVVEVETSTQKLELCVPMTQISLMAFENHRVRICKQKSISSSWAIETIPVLQGQSIDRSHFA
jgi:hypothetical protein